MNKNYLYLVATLVAALGLSACNDLSSPESTLASAYTAVSKNKLSDLRETLVGKALDAYGNAEGLKKLQTELAGLEMTTGNKTYVGGHRHDYRHYTYVYTLDVLVRQKGTKQYSRYKTANVVCEWHRGHRGFHHGCGHGGPHGQFPGPDCDIDTDTPDHQECLISELN